MCGIVGLFLTNRALEARLGELISAMLLTMSDRGPDAAGIAIYSEPEPGRLKITVQALEGDGAALDDLAAVLAEVDPSVRVLRKATHAVVSIAAPELLTVRDTLAERQSIAVTAIGEAVEIYKAVDAPQQVVDRFAVAQMTGTHGIGHARMATESAVTTRGTHPFSTGLDQCLVHNGSLSNHNNVRRALVHQGIVVETQNDSEVAAAFLTAQMNDGCDLGTALARSLNALDGFFTFVVGTRTGFGVLRDPIACKPAVMAEHRDYVAFGSEYRALVDLPGIADARMWEPGPGAVYVWDRDTAARTMAA